MAFKMKGSPLHSGTSSHKSALKHVDMTKPANHEHKEAGPGRGETKKEVKKANRLEDKNNNPAARKEYMEMMKAKKASPKKKSPLEKGRIDEKTGTLYQDGMAISDRPHARSEFKHSGVEINAAKALGSRKVDRVQKRAGKKSDKTMKEVKFGGKGRVGRVSKRRRKRSGKASDKADKVTTKTFQNTEQGGKDSYNRLIEQDNKRRKETAAARDADKK